MLRFRSSCIDHESWSGVVGQLSEDSSWDLRILLERLASHGYADDPLTEVLLLRLLLACEQANQQANAPATADQPHAQHIMKRALGIYSRAYRRIADP